MSADTVRLPVGGYPSGAKPVEELKPPPKGPGLGTRSAEYVCIGYRNPNVALILHSAAQHGKWQCKEMCVPVSEKRQIDGGVCG